MGTAEQRLCAGRRHRPDLRMSLSHPEINGLTERIIGAAISVHQEIGPGLLESNYEEALGIELRELGIAFASQSFVPVIYKGHQLSAFFRPDLIVDQQVVVEIKSVEKFAPVHRSQLLTYLRHTHLKVGFLFNFNSDLLKNGMLRISL
jgi:GxxExxY protein